MCIIVQDLGIVLMIPTTIGVIVSFIFHRFLNSPARFKYLFVYLFIVFYCIICWQAKIYYMTRFFFPGLDVSSDFQLFHPSFHSFGTVRHAQVTVGIIIITIIIIYSVFTSALADSFSLKSEWQ